MREFTVVIEQDEDAFMWLRYLNWPGAIPRQRHWTNWTNISKRRSNYTLKS